jgi:hypothetical protein
VKPARPHKLMLTAGGCCCFVAESRLASSSDACELKSTVLTGCATNKEKCIRCACYTLKQTETIFITRRRQAEKKQFHMQ